MKCMRCGATAEKGFTTSVTDLNNCLIIVRNVPCFKCTECNEISYTGDVIQQLEKIIDSARKVMQEISIQKSHKKPPLLPTGTAYINTVHPKDCTALTS